MSIETNFTGKEETAIARVELFTDAKSYPNEANRALVYHFERNVYDSDGNLLTSTFGSERVSTTFGAVAGRSFDVPMLDGSTFTATGLQAAALIKFVGYALLAEKQAADAAAAEAKKQLSVQAQIKDNKAVKKA